MKPLFATLTLLALCITPLASQDARPLPAVVSSAPTISGPEEVAAGSPAWFTIEGVGSGVSGAFMPTAMLDTTPGRVVPGNALFWTVRPGEYFLTAVVVDWNAKTFIPLSKQVTVKGTTPPNPPEPPVPPIPVPGERFVLIISETQDRTPEEAVVLAQLREYLRTTNVKWRIMDPSTDAAWLQPQLKKLEEKGVKGSALMVYVPSTDTSAGVYLAVDPLPQGAKEAINIIKEALK